MANEEHKYDFVDGINFGCGGNHLEVDSNYEFDAVNFFDFTMSETISEVGQAERWFDSADTYPPSPFVVKLIIEQLLATQQCYASSKSKEFQNENVNSSNSESKSKVINKPAESRSFSYMKPTASLLAKQNKLQEANCKHLFCRPPKPEEKSLRSSRSEGLMSKRQKLGRGYLMKVAQLNHQRLLLHKKSNNVTVPKGPQLETMQRAERRSSKNSSVSSENVNSKVNAVRARTRNSNVLDTYHDDSVSLSSKICPPRGVWEALTNMAVTT